MATKRKAKGSTAKASSKTKRKKPAKAATRKKPARAAKARGKKPAKKAPARRAAPRQAAPTARAKRKPAPARPRARAAPARPAASPKPRPGEERVGVVTHYYNHLSVAIVKLESGTLRVGDSIHVRGHTTDFSQNVESLEVDHAPATEVGPNDDFGLKVVDHAREHDVVYKVRR
jgi:Elongation factor Tu domain 2